jgi:hypothetical protein
MEIIYIIYIYVCTIVEAGSLICLCCAALLSCVCYAALPCPLLSNGRSVQCFSQHGGVHIGDVLFSINDISLMNMPFAEVKGLLKDTNIINKTLKFCNIQEHYSKK